MQRFRVTLAYDGTDFAGSQAQPQQRTVQGEMDRVLARILGVQTRTLFAGRTDRGVHATGQVAAFDMPAWRWGPAEVQRSLNASLPSDLRVVGASKADAAFHPRFDAAWREYRYWVAPGALSPFLGRYAWTTRGDVDLHRMLGGARYLEGTHDFASFAGGGEGVPWSERARHARGTTRTLFHCACREAEIRLGPGSDHVRAIEVVTRADGFLPRMVRNIVGALVEVGQGRRPPEWIAEVLDYRDRRLGSVVAPAHGLALTAVGYDDVNDGRWPAGPGQGGTDEGAA